MNLFKKLAVMAVILLASIFGAEAQVFAQSALVFTTLTNNVPAGASTITLTSITGFVASSGTQDYVAYVDKEAYRITGVTAGNLTIKVQSGYGPTPSTAHASGTLVYFGAVGGAANNYASNFQLSNPAGRCIRAGLALPVVNIRTGDVSDCQGGTWALEGPLPSVSYPAVPAIFCSVPVGSVAYASAGTSTTFVSGTIYETSIFVPRTFLATGVQILQNATVGTNSIIGALWNIDGTLYANSALAGTVTSGASTFRVLPFTAQKIVTGPAYYVSGVQANGTTDGIYTVPASTFKDINAKSQTGTFGTLPTITPATTFTATTAPFACLYQ